MSQIRLSHKLIKLYNTLLNQNVSIENMLVTPIEFIKCYNTTLLFEKSWQEHKLSPLCGWGECTFNCIFIFFDHTTKSINVLHSYKLHDTVLNLAASIYKIDTIEELQSVVNHFNNKDGTGSGQYILLYTLLQIYKQYGSGRVFSDAANLLKLKKIKTIDYIDPPFPHYVINHHTRQCVNTIGNNTVYKHNILTKDRLIKFESLSELLLICRLKSQLNVFQHIKFLFMNVLNFNIKNS